MGAAHSSEEIAASGGAPIFSGKACASAKTTRHHQTRLAKVRSAASIGPDGGAYLRWREAIKAALMWPWFERCTDGTPVEPIAQPEPFEALKSFAASGAKGCVAARKRLKAATNRGLAASLGRELPEALAK